MCAVVYFFFCFDCFLLLFCRVYHKQRAGAALTLEECIFAIVAVSHQQRHRQHRRRRHECEQYVCMKYYCLFCGCFCCRLFDFTRLPLSVSAVFFSSSLHKHDFILYHQNHTIILCVTAHKFAVNFSVSFIWIIIFVRFGYRLHCD